MYKTEKKFPILFTLVVLLLLGMVLFACETSNEQERQITNAFTPGQSTQDATLQTQQAEDSQTQTDTAVIAPGSQPETAPLPSDQPTMMITTTQGQPIIVTQTMAATQPNQPTNVSTATKKPANTAAATTTPTKTATLTPSPTMQTGWEGEWTAYLGQPDGSFRSGDLVVSVSGDSVTGVFDNAGLTMNLEGSFSTDEIFVSGEYTLPSVSGSFKWTIRENSYLVGNIDNEWAFCAARKGLPQPDPCGYFDPR